MEPATIEYRFPRQVNIYNCYLLKLTCLDTGNSWIFKVPCTGEEPVGTVPSTTMLESSIILFIVH